MAAALDISSIKEQMFWHRKGHPEENSECVAEFGYYATHPDELSFKKGEELVLLKPGGDKRGYWWDAQNSEGETGIVPLNFLRYKSEDTLFPDYEHMMSKVYPPGTEVVARADSKDIKAPAGLQPLQFKKGDKMIIVNVIEDNAGWYRARLTSCSGKPCRLQEGIVHDNILEATYEVYQRVSTMKSREEPEDFSQPLYDSFEEFQQDSMWFAFMGCETGSLDALYHRLASMANIEYDDFMKTNRAIYVMTQNISEECYVGAAHVLHKELAGHFLTWDKPHKSRFDRECYEVPRFVDWDVKVFPISPTQNLNVERAKKILALNALQPNGLNEEMVFGGVEEWTQFTGWLFHPGM